SIEIGDKSELTSVEAYLNSVGTYNKSKLVIVPGSGSWVLPSSPSPLPPGNEPLVISTFAGVVPVVVASAAAGAMLAPKNAVPAN
ncbi:hypothetical protein ACPTGN_15485, partial [Enterococcus faecalis]